MMMTHEVLLPLWAPLVSADLRFDVNLNKFGEVRMWVRAPGDSANITLNAPRVGVRLAPWPLPEGDELSPLTAQLAADFAARDALGSFAFRAGGASVIRRVETEITAPASARTLLHLRLEQELAEKLEFLGQIGSPFEPALTDSLLDAMRLVSRGDTLEHRVFHFVNGTALRRLGRWPLSGETGPRPGQIAQGALDALADFTVACYVARQRLDTPGGAVLVLALQQYFLAGVSPDAQSCFLHLMIAYEALFQAEAEKNHGALVARRMANAIASTRAEADELRQLMFADGKSAAERSCNQLRNDLAHGRVSFPLPATLERLREAIRASIASVLALAVTGRLDWRDYYTSLENACSERFRALPAQ